MRKNIIKNVIVHKVENSNIHTLSERMSQFHVDIIERKINQSGLSKKEKIEVIDRIMDTLK